ncbi:hypothetical protein AMECASPLE_028177 [Ameca splendens]|uniref:Uncharacterized protein n=1 Tax=Ameca splendens TaxID=208324 RepID=A0ABV0Z3A1_9TELE
MSQNLNCEKHKKPQTKQSYIMTEPPPLRADTRRPQQSKQKENPTRAGGGGLGRRARNKNRVQASDQEVVPSRHRVQAGDQACTKDVEADSKEVSFDLFMFKETLHL